MVNPDIVYQEENLYQLATVLAMFEVICDRYKWDDLKGPVAKLKEAVSRRAEEYRNMINHSGSSTNTIQ